ncbi:hypothetical protein D9M70_576350 [compost metagenome]
MGPADCLHDPVGNDAEVIGVEVGNAEHTALENLVYIDRCLRRAVGQLGQYAGLAVTSRGRVGMRAGNHDILRAVKRRQQRICRDFLHDFLAQ